jgi:hypothetical protein
MQLEPPYDAAGESQLTKSERKKAQKARKDALCFKGVACTTSSRRRYPHGPMMAHVLGYPGEPSAEDYRSLRDYGTLVRSPEARLAHWRRITASLPDGDRVRVMALLRRAERERKPPGRAPWEDPESTACVEQIILLLRGLDAADRAELERALGPGKEE